MTYSVKEAFYTLQGEGANAGRPAVFVRFSGCNLWSGRDQDRGKSCSAWCDTDFLGTDGPRGGRYDAHGLTEAVETLWPVTPAGRRPLVVLTGGEPMLQADAALIESLGAAGFEVAVETNGTVLVPSLVDWLTVSPKADVRVVQCSGDELKLVFPQAGVDPASYLDWGFSHFYLQPLDGPSLAENTAACVRYCLANPRWSLSLQTHKILMLK